MIKKLARVFLAFISYQFTCITPFIIFYYYYSFLRVIIISSHCLSMCQDTSATPSEKSRTKPKKRHASNSSSSSARDTNMISNQNIHIQRLIKKKFTSRLELFKDLDLRSLRGILGFFSAPTV